MPPWFPDGFFRRKHVDRNARLSFDRISERRLKSRRFLSWSVLPLKISAGRAPVFRPAGFTPPAELSPPLNCGCFDVAAPLAVSAKRVTDKESRDESRFVQPREHFQAENDLCFEPQLSRLRRRVAFSRWRETPYE